MPKSIQLQIPEPCHENWQNMTPQEQGRFCGACQKTVVDFSLMTDQEVMNYFLKADHNVCGRFANDQLNKELVVTGKKKRFSWAYAWNVILATLLITETNAQVKPKPKKPVTENIPQDRKMGKVAYVPGRPAINSAIPIIMKGKVVDESNNQPIIGASISVAGTTGGVMADTSGKFILKVQQKDSIVLEFSAIGYETQTRVVDDLTNWQDIQVYLQPAAVVLKDVYITSSITKGRVIMGGVRQVKTVKVDTIKNFINDWLPAAFKKNVKISPNPVMHGNSINVSLALKQPGSYKLEVLNAAGQVMLVQPLLMQTKEQLLDLHTAANWSAGIYWIRISAPNTKNVFQEKFLLH
ncbi:T9SS type A sorting domain-containing protein [Niastella caeni]|uniref:T9SS type A sorting domain-containing protein n=1 Tax=Niastella caeni TaxID=2569763 RepID=A0A4S8HY19_9BACT|nr:carboxypeptidase-like regulatory domain-containing protein [Niastella caeni]THU40643.1 T9SS type A sorting domain-containing protein [Niastella caeni]